MMFTKGRAGRYGIVSETASADMLDVEVDSDVKEVVEELEDDLTTNVDLVDGEDMETNNAVLTAESCIVFEASIGSGKYAVDIRDIMRICEAEEEMTGDAPDAGEVAGDVAAANDVDSDDLVIVAPAEVAAEIIESALNESKAGKPAGKAKKKLDDMAKAIKDIKNKGIKISVKKPSFGGKKAAKKKSKKRR